MTSWSMSESASVSDFYIPPKALLNGAGLFFLPQHATFSHFLCDVQLITLKTLIFRGFEIFPDVNKHSLSSLECTVVA